MLNKIASKIWTLDAFQQEYDTCLKFSVREQFQHVSMELVEVPKVNWRYLLESATVLLNSKEVSILDAVVRIATSCLIDKTSSVEHKAVAAWILEQLRNEVSVQLAIERGHLEKEYEKKRPTLLNIKTLANRLDSVVSLVDGSSAYLTSFQMQFWKDIEKYNYISASASTAAGKSYAVVLWICDALKRGVIDELIYIAPTRALVSEIESKLNEQCKAFDIDAQISSIPWEINEDKKAKRVFVLTQERYHLLMNRSDVQIVPDMLIVDEAHKIDEEVRGVILEAVVQQTVETYPKCKLIFISPSTQNPEILTCNFPDSEISTIKSSAPTVNQNLIWVSKVKGNLKAWTIDLVSETKTFNVGSFTTEDSHKNSPAKKLSFVAGHIGQGSKGNVVYTTTASDAEKIAVLLSQMIEVDGSDEALKDLEDLITLTVHRDFQLHTVIKKGVAFHYGNMPEILRREIERLFSEGVIQFLVCTSTLIEGVNLSCKNIFLRGAKKGIGNLMRQEDFWNLAGRAGRWGKEFAGNIYCIEPTDENIWLNGNAPRTKEGIKIARSTSTYVCNLPSKQVDLGGKGKDLGVEGATLSLVVRAYLRDKSLQRVNFLSGVDTQKTQELESLANEVLKLYEDHPELCELISKNPHISPVDIMRLFEFLNSNIVNITDYKPIDPSDEGAVDQYARLFLICGEYLNANKLGGNEALALRNSLVVCRWMSGWKIPRIIDSSIKYWKRRDPKKAKSTIIRDILNDIENVARFHAPNYLSCYVDVFTYVVRDKGVPIDLEELKAFSVMLEYGVSSITELSLISLGISRNTAIIIFEHLKEDDLSPEEAKAKLKTLGLDILDLPELIKNELLAAISE